VACTSKKPKAKGALISILAALLACPVFFAPANASNSPWLDKAIDHLTQAQAATDETTQSDLLNSALKDLQTAKNKHPEKTTAITLVQSALSDLKAGDSSKVKDDITQAIADIQVAAGISDTSTDTQPPPAPPDQPPATPGPPPAPPAIPPPVPPAAPTPPPAPAANVPVSGQPWQNSLGMKFVPAGTDDVLFSIWDTRLKDFQAFFAATGYDATAGMTSMQKRGDSWKSPGFAQTEDDPVVGMSGNDGDAFCQWLTKKEQADGTLGPNQEYRLPTDAEWTTAVGSTKYPWGNDWPPPAGAGNYAGSEALDENWDKRPTLDGYNDGYPRTSPVGSFKPNAYGLYDMGGNVWQWCEDTDGSALRGAAWTNSLSKDMASSFILQRSPDGRFDDRGFRVVLVVSSPKNAAPNNSGGSNAFGNSPGATRTSPSVEHSAPTVALTTDQARAVVLIKGDHAEGTGFLVKTADGPAVVTNLHVISDNPNLKITTNTGQQITVLSLKGASDRDLAMFAIKDQNYSYLPLSTDISGIAQPGDEVVTPGNSEGGEVMLNTKGKLLGIGPERIEFNNPIYHGNSGGPVLHTKSGQVLGVVTEAMKVIHEDDLDKTSFASRNSAIAGSMRYFGLRIDTVPKWEPYDLQRFQAETALLGRFDQRNRSLDSYLNTPHDYKPDSILYRQDADIVKANAAYFSQSDGGDMSQRMDALRELLGDLNSFADADMDVIQQVDGFYSFDQQRARDEIAYRKALKKELDEIGANTSYMSNLPRRN
jgi:hypothetical protein